MTMKVHVLGLALASTVFAGSALYLGQQLEQERTHAAQVENASRQLIARLAEFERARGESNQHRVASTGMIIGTSGPPAAGAPAPLTLTPSDGKPQATEGHVVWTTGRPDRSPAFQKMMRSQIRANTRRQYADVGEKLGLSKEKTSRLIDLLAEQQAEVTVDAAEFGESGEAQRDYEQKQREQELAISDLIGPDKALALKDYQESLPARMEMDMLARQLEDNGAALSEAQRKQLIDVVVEERKRVPMPEYVEGADQVEYSKAANAWRDDYEKRVAAEASHILNADQLTAYDDIQQWQKALREQLATVGFAPTGTTTRVRRGGDGNVVTFTSAAPAFVSGTIVNQVVPSPAPEQKKP